MGLSQSSRYADVGETTDNNGMVLRLTYYYPSSPTIGAVGPPHTGLRWDHLALRHSPQDTTQWWELADINTAIFDPFTLHAADAVYIPAP